MSSILMCGNEPLGGGGVNSNCGVRFIHYERYC